MVKSQCLRELGLMFQALGLIRILVSLHFALVVVQYYLSSLADNHGENLSI